MKRAIFILLMFSCVFVKAQSNSSKEMEIYVKNSLLEYKQYCYNDSSQEILYIYKCCLTGYKDSFGDVYDKCLEMIDINPYLDHFNCHFNRDTLVWVHPHKVDFEDYINWITKQ